jgi:hypothetical protein
VFLAAVPPPCGGKEEHCQEAKYQADVSGNWLHPTKNCRKRKTLVVHSPVVVFPIAVRKVLRVAEFSEPGPVQVSNLLDGSWEYLPSTISDECSAKRTPDNNDSNCCNATHDLL